MKAINPSVLCKDLFKLLTCKLAQDDFEKKYGKYQVKQENDLIIIGDEEEDDDIIVISVD